MNAKSVALLACCAGLLAVGCTEKTVVREVPASVDQAAASTDDAAAMTPTPIPFAVQGETSTEAEPSDTAPSLTLFDDPDAVTGDPGASVDCGASVPCRWLSGDGGLAVTVTRVDHADGGLLEVDFRLDATRETTLAFGGMGSATDGAGAALAPARRALEGGRGETPLEASPGHPLSGRLAYADGAKDGLARLALALLDSGFAREASFLNLPVGPLASEHSDCAFALPCTWTSPDGATRVTLELAGGFETERRLVASFAVESAESLALVLDGAEALGTDGTRFEGRLRSLGQTRHHRSAGAEAIANVPLAARVDFFRTTARPEALARLTLGLHRDAPVPRWDIRFENVPLGGADTSGVGL